MERAPFSDSAHDQDRPRVELRDVCEEDLPVFFEQQLDPGANQMAAFTRAEPADRAAFDDHWKRIRGDEAVVLRTIIADGDVAGHVASFERFQQREVTYWLGRPFWGRGIASAALRIFLEIDRHRPLHARVVADNGASIRVLEKCGFEMIDRESHYANARGREMEELVMRLERA